MKVVVVADPWIPIPPSNYGGTERIVDLICRGLAQRGHAVHLVAGRGSKDYGAGVTLHRPPSLNYVSRALRKIWFQFLLLRATAGAAVVINHGRLDYLEALYQTRRPAIHWFHNPLTGSEVPYVLSRRKTGDTFVAISRAQVARDANGGRFKVLPNAVDPDSVPFSPVASEPPYVLFLGRLTRNKGVHLAIDAARRAGLKLVIGGNISQEEGGPDYFATKVKPRLGPECEWIGPYDETTRNRLLAGATALLFPIEWDEPFGLVMIESMASGVPVIALRRASTPEVIADRKTGFLCDSVDEMAVAIRRVREISRKECRTWVERYFSATRLTDGVEALMTEVVSARP